MVKVVPAPSGEGPPVVVVRFSEWAKVQETKRTQVVALTEVPDDEGAAESSGCCELCGRQMQLTFHHLLPKETHARCPSTLEPVDVPRRPTHQRWSWPARYLGKRLPDGVAAAATATGLGAAAEPTREFLNTYGAELCRFCTAARAEECPLLATVHGATNRPYTAPTPPLHRTEARPRREGPPRESRRCRWFWPVPAQSRRCGRRTGTSPMAIDVDCTLFPCSPTCLPWYLPGHSTVHRLAPNAVLAERFNTVECLCAQPELAKFASFASRQRETIGRTR